MNEQFAKVPDAPDPEIETAPPYKKRITRKPHRQDNLLSDWSSTQSFTCLLSDRSSTQSFTCATRLTDWKIRTQWKQSHTHNQRQIFASVLKMWTAKTYGKIWSEYAVGKCPWSSDRNSTSLRKIKIPINNATPSGQSSPRSIFTAIIHMRHTTYRLQNIHAVEIKPHTQATVRSLFSQIDLQCNRSHAPHDLQTAK